MPNAPSPTDEELMTRYLSGDSRAFQTLYERHSGKVFAYLLRKSKKRESAEELHQSVFLKFHRTRHLYDRKFPLLQWLYVIAKTTTLDFYRKEGRQVPIADGADRLESAPAPAPEDEDSFARERDLSSLERLEPGERQAVEWRYLEELAYSEIAGRLGKTEVGVRQVVSRAIRKLRRSGAREGNEA